MREALNKIKDFKEFDLPNIKEKMLGINID
jgi:hypothetical protein